MAEDRSKIGPAWFVELSAYKGDFQPLLAYLRGDGELDPSVRTLLADMIEGTGERSHRFNIEKNGRVSQEQNTFVRDWQIASHVQQAEKQKTRTAAVKEAAEEFGCSEKVAWDALKPFRGPDGKAIQALEMREALRFLIGKAPKTD